MPTIWTMKALSNRKLKVSHPQGFKTLGVGESPILSLIQENLQWSVSIWLFSPFIIFLFQLGCICKRGMNQVENIKKSGQNRVGDPWGLQSSKFTFPCNSAFDNGIPAFVQILSKVVRNALGLTYSCPSEFLPKLQISWLLDGWWGPLLLPTSGEAKSLLC